MKRVGFSLLLLLAVVSCKNVGDDEFVINGSINGVADGKNVVLEKNSDSLGIVPVDTVKVKDGKFRFEGKANDISMYSIAVEGVQSPSYLVMENGTINIEINKDTVFRNKISGTYNNEELTNFNAIGMKIQKKIQDFQVANTPKLKAAQAANDTATVKQLQADYAKIQKEMEASTYKYIETHPKSYISVLLIQSMFNVPEPDTKKIEGYYNGLEPELKTTAAGKKIVKKLNDFKVVGIGRVAPQFSAPDVNGKMVSLKESLGKLTIIDFWASWCGPCRAENPHMVELYNEFHGKGLNIIGVSLDKPGQADKWKEAIAKDGLTWTQVSNLKFWDDPIAATYGVQQIPTMFVLNEFGVVVAKDLRGDQLKAKVAQFLTK